MIMAPRKKLQGVDDELQKLLDANMDGVAARRRAREAFKGIQLGIDHILFKVFWYLDSLLDSCSCMLLMCLSILDDLICCVICLFLVYGNWIFDWISVTFIVFRFQTPSDGLKMEEVISEN